MEHQGHVFRMGIYPPQWMQNWSRGKMYLWPQNMQTGLFSCPHTCRCTLVPVLAQHTQVNWPAVKQDTSADASSNQFPVPVPGCSDICKKENKSRSLHFTSHAPQRRRDSRNGPRYVRAGRKGPTEPPHTSLRRGLFFPNHWRYTVHGSLLPVSCGDTHL